MKEAVEIDASSGLASVRAGAGRAGEREREEQLAGTMKPVQEIDQRSDLVQAPALEFFKYSCLSTTC